MVLRTIQQKVTPQLRRQIRDNQWVIAHDIMYQHQVHQPFFLSKKIQVFGFYILFFMILYFPAFFSYAIHF